MKVLLCVITLVLMLPSLVVAQDHEPQFKHEKYKQPTQLIAEGLLPEVHELSKLCVSSVTFVRFVVGADGNVKNVACTQDTPAVIAKSLKQTVLATNGHWSPREVNGVAVESKPYLLPVVYDVNFGCPKSGQSVSKFEDAIQHVLVFDDGTVTESMECTLLPPMVQRYVKSE
ncbi:hypothetical protein DXT99_07280 [Pontibacter diazotrophicus]|uniref:TonB C-terminal domain-containing protein n=1 Tax=Pontibacter diazotrophicus TaxID=1400979 RepID=A0A3D8LEH1_9BACT|nr:hypothetical protein [Pontibacter diazotrophicus]RDV15800.1 hypothetical protein DXT99_07280 [Pontibacter diazotrophicus]